MIGSLSLKPQSSNTITAGEYLGVLVALPLPIRAQRYEMALTILDNELGGGC